MFFFEHVLMRLEKSKYKDNIILKGGVLLSSIIGEELRTTKDIDTTLKSLPLNIDTIKNEQTSKININTASISELDDLPGVGEATANKIYKYREENGNFKSIEEITIIKKYTKFLYKNSINFYICYNYYTIFFY